MPKQELELELKKKQPQTVSSLNLFRFSGRALEFKRIENLLKFCLMVSCVVSFLLVFHADICSEHYQSFFIQAGVSASFVPSVFRVTLMFTKTSPSSLFIDMTVLMFITIHLTAASIVLYLVIVELTPDLAMLQVSLVGAVTFTSLSVSMCVAEILGLILAGTQSLRRRSSTRTTSESALELKDQVTAVI